MGQIRGVIGGFNGPGFRSQGLGKVTGTRGFLSNNLPFRHNQGLTPYDYPFELFALGEPGLWYDPSDFSTMFQDSAGTTPVTAVGQPVGKWLDKSGRGNHAIQATSANRPVVSARYNLLTSSEDFTAAAWGKTALTATPNATQASDGTLTATALTSTINGNATVAQNKTVAINTSHVIRGEFKAGTVSTTQFGFWDNTLGGWLCLFNLDLVSGIATLASGTGTAVTSNLGNGWWSISITATTGANPSTAVYMYPHTGGGALIGDSIYSSRIDLRTAADAALKIPSYQRVNTATDYDTVGFPYYLAFNGTNSSLATTGNVDLTGTAQATVFGGAYKASDAAVTAITEFSANATLNNGSFYLVAPSTASGNDIQQALKGDAGAQGATATGYPSPIYLVSTSLLSISGPTNQLRVNGTLKGTNPASVGAGNFGSYPLYIGARGNSSLFFNGRIYSLIVRGASSAAQEIANTEAFINGKMGGVF